MPIVSVRQARTFLAVARHSSVTGAARAINRSQTSVTKSIQDLERELGVELFDRSPKGVTLTAYGTALFRGAQQAALAFERASGLVAPFAIRESPSIARFFRMDVSEKWLDAFLATAECQNLAAAAHRLNVTPAAVSASLRKLEDSLNTTLFERTPNATVPTTFASSLVRYIKLARNHLRHACDELASLEGIKRGRVVIGSLPLMRTMMLPRAIVRLHKQHPFVEVSTMEGRYADLAAALRCGDIDFIVGALRGSAIDEDLAEESLFEDCLSFIVRHGHPLLARPDVGLADLLALDWVLPRRSTPGRALFEAALTRRGLPMPAHVIETSSLVTLRGLLMQGDYVTALSRHQVVYEEQHGMLATLPLELPDTSRPIGLTRRAHGSVSPAADLLMRELRTVVAEISPSLHAA